MDSYRRQAQEAADPEFQVELLKREARDTAHRLSHEELQKRANCDATTTLHELEGKLANCRKQEADMITKFVKQESQGNRSKGNVVTHPGKFMEFCAILERCLEKKRESKFWLAESLTVQTTAESPNGAAKPNWCHSPNLAGSNTRDFQDLNISKHNEPPRATRGMPSCGLRGGQLVKKSKVCVQSIGGNSVAWKCFGERPNGISRHGSANVQATIDKELSVSEHRCGVCTEIFAKSQLVLATITHPVRFLLCSSMCIHGCTCIDSSRCMYRF